MTTTLPLPVALVDRELAVSTRGLGKRYGTQPALRGLDLQVPRGSFYLLVGPNGAGKSTLLKLLLDLVRATDGSASVFHLDPSRHGATVRANTGYVPERPDWAYGWMTVGRVLQHHSRYFDRWDAEYAARLIATFDVRLDRRLETLSKGQARRVHPADGARASSSAAAVGRANRRALFLARATRRRSARWPAMSPKRKRRWCRRCTMSPRSSRSPITSACCAMERFVPNYRSSSFARASIGIGFSSLARCGNLWDSTALWSDARRRRARWNGRSGARSATSLPSWSAPGRASLAWLRCR